MQDLWLPLPTSQSSASSATATAAQDPLLQQPCSHSLALGGYMYAVSTQTVPSCAASLRHRSRTASGSMTISVAMLSHSDACPVTCQDDPHCWDGAKPSSWRQLGASEAGCKVQGRLSICPALNLPCFRRSPHTQSVTQRIWGGRGSLR